MIFTQDNRILKIDTPLGNNVLLLTDIYGTEGVSMLFNYELTLTSPKKDIDFKSIIGKPVTISITLLNGNTRHINGIVSRFAQGEGWTNDDTGHSFASYSATVTPSLWLLGRTSDCEIFQNLSVPEIVEKVLKDNKINDYRIDIKDSYPKWEYCVQYNETDLHFISRLLEEEGIYYYFEHEKAKHTLVLADRKDCHKKCPNQETARYKVNNSHIREDEVITTLEWEQEIRFGKHTVKDFNFATPHTKLAATVPTKHAVGPGEREAYFYSSGHDSISEGKRVSKIRMEEDAAQGTIISGSSDCRAFESGYRFKLQDYFRSDMNNKEYLLTFVEHEACQPIGTNSVFHYCNSFNCIPYEVQFRPPWIHQKPLMSGSQTATVTGPKGEEIHVDQHGRVKVQFHWDRYGKKNEKSSCWIRVSNPGSSKGFGFQSHPRIGDEVVVDFLEGDPDRPIITGSVYNASNIGTYALPANKTRTVLRANSTPGGGGFNELHFENKKGSEVVYLQAEKDCNVLVKNNRSQAILGNSYVEVKNKQTELSKEMILASYDKITIVSGPSSIVITPAGIKINGPKVDINDGSKAPMPSPQAVPGSGGSDDGGSSAVRGGGSGGGSSSPVAGSSASTPAGTSAPASVSASGDDWKPGPVTDSRLPDDGWKIGPVAESRLDHNVMAGTKSANVAATDDWKLGPVTESASGLGDLVSSGPSSPLLKGDALPGTGDLVSSATSSLPGYPANRVSQVASVAQNPASIKDAAVNEARSRANAELNKAAGKVLEKTGMQEAAGKAAQGLDKAKEVRKISAIHHDELVKKL